MTKFEKVHIIGLVLTFTPSTLALPHTVPLAQRQQAVTGVVKWTAPEWSKTEYERVQRTIDSVITACSGTDIEKVVIKIAEAVAKVIPDRNFTLSIGSFGIECKGKKKGG